VAVGSHVVVDDHNLVAASHSPVEDVHPTVAEDVHPAAHAGPGGHLCLQGEGHSPAAVLHGEVDGHSLVEEALHPVVVHSQAVDSHLAPEGADHSHPAQEAHEVADHSQEAAGHVVVAHSQVVGNHPDLAMDSHLDLAVGDTPLVAAHEGILEEDDHRAEALQEADVRSPEGGVEADDHTHLDQVEEHRSLPMADSHVDLWVVTVHDELAVDRPEVADGHNPAEAALVGVPQAAAAGHDTHPKQLYGLEAAALPRAALPDVDHPCDAVSYGVIGFGCCCDCDVYGPDPETDYLVY